MTLNLNLWIVNRFYFCWETNSPLRRETRFYGPTWRIVHLQQHPCLRGQMTAVG